MPAPVIILNWNGWEDSCRCLTALKELPEVERVWLVDNGSAQDRTAEVAVSFPGVRILRWETNLGFAGGYNRALRLAAHEGNDFAYLLNNDAIPRPGFLRATILAANSDAALAAIGSQLLHPPPHDSVEFDGEHHEPGRQPVATQVGLRSVETVSGAAMLARLSVMQRCGYFDERFFCYWEETEWCARVRREGMRCAIALGSVVVHKAAGSDRNFNRSYYMIRNNLLYLKLTRPADLAARRREVLHKAAVWAEDARRRRAWAEWEALAAALDDARSCQFGQRREGPVSGFARARLAVLSAWAHVRDKSRRHMRPTA